MKKQVLVLFLSYVLSIAIGRAQTIQVKDIYPGSSGGAANARFIELNGVMYFSANDGINGIELWKSNGTASGTVMVKDINPGAGNSFAQSFIALNGYIYFSATDGSTGSELWRSDGTLAGTTLVKDVYTGASSSYPSFMIEVGGILYFQAFSPGNGGELWRSDGTTAGTYIVKDVNPGSFNAMDPIMSPSPLINVGGTIFFSAETAANGIELWKSDGTAAGTVLVKDIVSGTGSSSASPMLAANGLLYFRAYTAALGYELWVSDGTDPGTVLVKDINTGTGHSLPGNLIYCNNAIYFSATTAASGVELWKSDGTASGTNQVREINAGSASALGNSGFSILNNELYFAANNGSIGTELWKSDGTSAGTVLVKDIYSGSSASNPKNFYLINDGLFFTADDGGNGEELWRTDGTAVGTVVKSNINLSGSSSPTSLFNFGNYLYFVANDGSTGSELWKLDVPLPLTLMDFSVHADQLLERIELGWTAPGQSGIEKFIIERRREDSFFQEIYSINIKEQGNIIQSYKYADAAVVKGHSYYYRIKQLDKDGLVFYSEIKKTALRAQENLIISPNPVIESFVLEGQTELQQIEIVDIYGKSIFSGNIKVGEKIDLSSLTNGVYIVWVKQFEENAVYLKFIKQ